MRHYFLNANGPQLSLIHVLYMPVSHSEGDSLQPLTTLGQHGNRDNVFLKQTLETLNTSINIFNN